MDGRKEQQQQRNARRIGDTEKIVFHGWDEVIKNYEASTQRFSHYSFSALAECFCGQVLITRGKFGKPLEPGVQSKTK